MKPVDNQFFIKKKKKISPSDCTVARKEAILNALLIFSVYLAHKDVLTGHTSNIGQLTKK